MADNVDAITDKLDRLVLDLLTMSDAINKQEGTLGQLIYDPDLYQRLNRAAGNVEQVSHRLRPIVEDVRVFTDKIARDPGQLGVRGALQRNSSRNKFFPFGNVLRGSPTGGQMQWNQTMPAYQMSPTVMPMESGAPVHQPYAPGTLIYQQQSQWSQPVAAPVQPAAHEVPASEAALPQWSPTRPSRATTPQQFWQSR